MRWMKCADYFVILSNYDANKCFIPENEPVYGLMLHFVHRIQLKLTVAIKFYEFIGTVETAESNIERRRFQHGQLHIVASAGRTGHRQNMSHPINWDCCKFTNFMKICERSHIFSIIITTYQPLTENHYIDSVFFQYFFPFWKSHKTIFIVVFNQMCFSIYLWMGESNRFFCDGFHSNPIYAIHEIKTRNKQTIWSSFWYAPSFACEILIWFLSFVLFKFIQQQLAVGCWLLAVGIDSNVPHSNEWTFIYNISVFHPKNRMILATFSSHNYIIAVSWWKIRSESWTKVDMLQ